jgi:DNA-binding FadR family transcriptional regulator
MNLPPVGLASITRRPSLASDVAETLRTQITSGAWPVGSRIPTEAELVNQLGIARNTIREAVRALAHTGLLEIRQGSGTYVIATSELAGVMQRRFAGAKLADINEFRAALESAAAALAATRRTAADLRRIDRALAAREERWQDGDHDGFAAADATFHLAVVAAAHNEVISEIAADFHTVVRDRIGTELGTAARPKYVDHARLVDAIRAKIPDQAAAEAAAHPHSWARR